MAKRGIHSIGVDLSAKKIRPRATWRKQGVADRCEFFARRRAAVAAARQVDLLTSHGRRTTSPTSRSRSTSWSRTSWRRTATCCSSSPTTKRAAPAVSEPVALRAAINNCRRFFDIDFYLEVTGQPSLTEPPLASAAAANEMNVRHEPGRQGVLRRARRPRRLLPRALRGAGAPLLPLLQQRHATNAFYVFMKSRVVRWLWRMVLPMVVWRDTRHLRDPPPAMGRGTALVPAPHGALTIRVARAHTPGRSPAR